MSKKSLRVCPDCGGQLSVESNVVLTCYIDPYTGRFKGKSISDIEDRYFVVCRLEGTKTNLVCRSGRVYSAED